MSNESEDIGLMDRLNDNDHYGDFTPPASWQNAPLINPPRGRADSIDSLNSRNSVDEMIPLFMKHL